MSASGKFEVTAVNTEQANTREVPQIDIAEPLQIDQDEESRARQRRLTSIARWTLPSLVLFIVIGGWQAWVTLAQVPHYIMPSPVLVAQTLVQDWQVLWPAMQATGRLTFLALLFAVLGGLLLAVAFTQSKWVELAMFPYAVILQVMSGPSALPYFLGGLKIAGGLALIGAVVAEFVIGRAGTGLGLASTLLEASYRFNFGRLYAALILISLMGIAIFGLMSLISYLCLYRWHESAVKREI